MRGTRGCTHVNASNALLRALVVGVLAAPGGVRADLRITVGQLEADFSGQRAWTLLRLTFNGRAICENAGSAQGTVLHIEGVGWVGSAHGEETVLESELLVDGQPVPLSDNASYTGTCAVLTRLTELGGSYRLRSVMSLAPDGVWELLTLQGLDASRNVDLVYGFLGSRANRLTACAGFDAAGREVVNLTTDADDGFFAALDQATAVAQYDPLAQDGVCSAVTLGQELGLRQFVWDRLADNKLYARFDEIAGPAEPGRRFTLRQQLRFFQAEPDDWSSAARQVLPPMDVPGDANLDGRVNVQDVSVLATNWGLSPSWWTDGDFNDDAAVGIEDLSILATHWSAAAGAAPEPTALWWLLLAAPAAAAGHRRRRGGREVLIPRGSRRAAGRGGPHPTA